MKSSFYETQSNVTAAPPGAAFYPEKLAFTSTGQGHNTGRSHSDTLNFHDDVDSVPITKKRKTETLRSPPLRNSLSSKTLNLDSNASEPIIQSSDTSTTDVPSSDIIQAPVVPTTKKNLKTGDIFALAGIGIGLFLITLMLIPVAKS